MERFQDHERAEGGGEGSAEDCEFRDVDKLGSIEGQHRDEERHGDSHPGQASRAQRAVSPAGDRVSRSRTFKDCFGKMPKVRAGLALRAGRPPYPRDSVLGTAHSAGARRRLDGANDATGVTGGEDIWREVARYDTARANDGILEW